MVVQTPFGYVLELRSALTKCTVIKQKQKTTASSGLVIAIRLFSGCTTPSNLGKIVLFFVTSVGWIMYRHYHSRKKVTFLNTKEIYQDRFKGLFYI